MMMDVNQTFGGEGFCLSTVETFAPGVPSILTQISTYMSFDEKKDFVYIVPTHRLDQIAEGLLVFIEDKGLKERYRERGISVSQGFTLETKKNDLLNFMKEFI
jgi:glycosyltransferase involved in cell wall biosynthesis